VAGALMLPNAAEARVPEDKIVKYLLSATHRAGKSKAAFFARFGFTAQRWEELAKGAPRFATAHPLKRKAA